MEITDLDVVVPEPKKIRFGGVEYAVPADLPMEIFLRLNQANAIRKEDGSPDQVKQIEVMTDVLSDLFTWELVEKNATPEQIAPIKEQVHKILMRRGSRFVFSLVGSIYKDDDEKADANETDPTAAPAQPDAA